MRVFLILAVLLANASCVTSSKSQTYPSSDGSALKQRGIAAKKSDGVPLNNRIYTSGAEIMSYLETLAQQLFATSGFPDSAAIEAQAKASGGPTAQAQDLLMNEKLEIAIALTKDRRAEVVKSGFLNFRQTKARDVHEGGTSVQGREIIEGNYIGDTAAAYAQIDTSLKPKSGYLSPPLNSGLKLPRSLSSFGEDHYIFKTSAVKSRASLSAGSSLNRRVAMEGEVKNDWNPIQTWDQIYTPWSQRALLIPFLADALEANKTVGVAPPTFTETYNQLLADFPNQHEIARFSAVSGPARAEPDQPTLWASTEGGPYSGKGAFASFKASWGTALDYIEVQIWGGLILDDVLAFEFTKTPPSGSFLAELKRRGIEIRDARKFPVTIWDGKS